MRRTPHAADNDSFTGSPRRRPSRYGPGYAVGRFWVEPAAHDDDDFWALDDDDKATGRRNPQPDFSHEDNMTITKGRGGKGEQQQHCSFCSLNWNALEGVSNILFTLGRPAQADSRTK